MPKINRPFVAVITPLYNDPTRIVRAMELVRQQTFQDYVHYICDDFSTDNSAAVVRKYIAEHPDAHIVFASLDENLGQSNARNKLMHEAFLNKADYIAFLDSDDYWASTHLEKSIQALETEHAGMAYSKPIFVDDDGNEMFAYNIPVDQEPTYAKLSKANSIYVSTVVMTRICAETVGEFDDELNCIEDWDYWLRVLKAGFKIIEVYNNATFYLIRTDGMASKSTNDKLIKFKQKHMLVDDTPIKLNLGCGDEILAGYINCDMDSAKADMLFDAAKIPFPDNSVDEIRAYHLIEHFPFQKGLGVLKEWFRVLKPNGKLVTETPDLLNTCKKFVEVDEQSRIVLYGHFFAWPDLSPWQTHYFLFTETQMHWSLESVGFTNIQRVPPDSIYARCNPTWQELYMKTVAYKPAATPTEKPKIYDCFLFYNELDLLELRLNELNDVVDKFVLVESDTTFTGIPKRYYYNENKDRFKKFEDKIVHLMVTGSPVTGSPWDAETYQRNSIYDGLKTCTPQDVVMISDVDEIPNVEAIRGYEGSKGVSLLQQRTSFYYLNCVSNFFWWNAKIGLWQDVQKETASEIRANNVRPVIENGGWHFTCLGGEDAILNKLNAFSHQELNTDHFRDRQSLARKIKNGWDMYDRIGCTATYWDSVEDFPRYIRDHKQLYIDKGLIREIIPPELPLSQEKYAAVKELNHSLYDEVFVQGGYMMYAEDVQDKVFVDVGSNIGVTVIKALSLGAKKVLSFEPNMVNYEILEKLTSDYGNVTNYNHAVYNSASSVRVTNEGMLSNMFHTTESDQIAPAMPLSSIVAMLQPNEQAVLKLDCEGAEFDIIYNSPPQTVKRFSTIFFEVHNDLVPQYLNGDVELMKYLTSLGFECERLPFSSGVWYPDESGNPQGTFVPTFNSFYKCKNKNL